MFVRGKWATLSTRMVHARNSGSTLRMVLKFCTVKGAKRHMNIFMVPPPKNLVDHFGQGKWAILGPRLMHPRNSGSALKIWQGLRGT